MVKHRSFPSLFNLQSTSINFNFGHLSAKYQGYSLTFWLKIAHFHHFSLCNQHQSISILIICRQDTKVIALLFWPIIAYFHHFSICNQHQSISILIICRQNTKVIALLFGQKSLIFITFTLQSTSINFNFCHLLATYQGYSLTFWPIIAYFHHFSICNQHQSISILIICRQHTKVIALLFGQTSLIFITFTLQSTSINFNFCHLLATYQGYSLPFWPKIAHFHHFSLCNQHQSISIFVICRQHTKVIALHFGQ